MIVHALVKLAGWGFGVGRSSVQSIVADYLQIIGVGGMSESTGFMDLRRGGRVNLHKVCCSIATS